MIYFKCTDKDGKKQYGVCADRLKTVIKELWNAETLEEISKEEYKRGVEQMGRTK